MEWDNDNFDYDYYLEKYEDLRRLNTTKEDAIWHWQTYGKKEGRTCNRKSINFITNITIIIHLFIEELFDEFLEYIETVNKVFNNVNVIFTISQNSDIETRIKSINNKYVVIKVENKGVDVYPFVESVRYMRKHFQTDFVLKIHTKISNNEMYSDWRKKLIKPITKRENLIILQHYFKKIKNIGYVGAQFCCLQKTYDEFYPQNIQGLKDLCDKFPHLPKEWSDFLGGTMFWISNETLNQLTDELIDYIIKNVCYEKPPCNLTDSGIYVEYICERLFTGIMCYEKTNILINENEPAERTFNIDEHDDETQNYFYSPKVFSIYQPKNVILN